MACVHIFENLLALRNRQLGDLLVDAGQAVVDVDAELLEQLTVLGKRVFVEDANGVTEDDRV